MAISTRKTKDLQKENVRSSKGKKNHKKHDHEISLIKTDEHYEICTGVMRARINRKKFSLIQTLDLGTRLKDGSFKSDINVFENNFCESWVRIEESSHDGSKTRRLYGMGVAVSLRWRLTSMRWK